MSERKIHLFLVHGENAFLHIFNNFNQENNSEYLENLMKVMKQH